MSRKNKSGTLLSYFSKKRKPDCLDLGSDNSNSTKKNNDCENESCLPTSVPSSTASTSRTTTNPPALEYKCTTKSKSEYKFINSWSDKYKWLFLDKEKGGAFCNVCSKYYQNDLNILQKTKGVFIKIPFTNYKKATGATGKLEKHNCSEHHINALAKENFRILHENKPIHAILAQQSKVEIEENRSALKVFVRCLYFLVKEETAHTTKYESIIRNLMSPCVDSLKNWLEKQSERATYCSKDTASELLQCMGEILDEEFADKLRGKPFALMADESTSIANKSELSICVRYVNYIGGEISITESFLCIVSLESTTAEYITNCIEHEIKKRNLSFDNLVACGFDGGSNFAGCVSGVQKRISEKIGRVIPYIHCRAHILSLAITSAKNNFPYVKRFFYVVKDIYKLFHQSPKRESALHEIQKMLEEPILKIPEATDVRWLSNYNTINAIKKCYGSIMMTCEHLHKSGADLASLAGGVLLEMEKSSFVLTLCLLVEVLGAVSNLSKCLQKKDCLLTALPHLILSTSSHLKSISEEVQKAAKQEENIITDCYNEIKLKVSNIRVIKSDKSEEKTCMHNLGKFTDTVIAEMNKRFNKQAVELITACSRFQSFESFQQFEDAEIKKLCQCLNIADEDHLAVDIKSFKFLTSTVKENSSPAEYIMKCPIGYEELRNASVKVMTVPITTATVERSFSTMNRIMTPLRNRLGDSSLDHCARISIEGPEIPSDHFLNKTVDRYACKKQRRVRFI